MREPLVTLLVLNHQGQPYLRRLMPSLLAQTHQALDVLVVDNASPDGSIAIVRDEFRDPRVRVLELPRNLGFSAGNNAGLREARGDYVMLLNNDVALDHRCVEHLVAAAAGRGPFGALAPKILWFHRPEYVEGVGTCCTPDGTGYNLGVGHVDVGQFDRPERVFGACFAAAFFRRAVFDEVGLLDESYFMYYEDIDWCYRANRLGHPVWTVPDARVYHVHSGTLRYTGAQRKWYFLTRNHVRFGLQNLPDTTRQLVKWARLLTPLRYWRVWLTPADVRRRVRAGVHIGVRLPMLLLERRRRRNDPRIATRDDEIFALSRDRESFFVSEQMIPEPSFRALIATMRELFRTQPTPENAGRLGLVLALRHLVGMRPSAAIARAAFDAWAASVRALPNSAELLRIAATVPALAAALDGDPPPRWPWPHRVPERRLRSRRLGPAAFVLATAFGATGEPTALRALGVLLAHWEFRRRVRGTGGPADVDGERALAQAWQTARGALPATVQAAPGAGVALGRVDRVLASRAAEPAIARDVETPVPRAAAE